MAEFYYQEQPFHRNLRQTGRLLGLIIKLAWQANPRLVAAILLLVVLQSALSPVELALSKAVIDRIALDLNLNVSSGGLASLMPLPAWIAITALVISMAQLIEPFTTTMQSIAGDRLTGHFEGLVIRAANRWKGLARFEDPSFANDLHVVRENSPRAGLEIMIYGVQTSALLCTSVGFVFILARLHPLVPLFLLLANLPQMAREWDYSERTADHLHFQTPQTRKLEYFSDTMLDPQPAKDVRLYGLASFFAVRYGRIFTETTATLDRLRRKLLKNVVLARLLSGVAAGAVYVFVVWRIATGGYTVGDLALYGGAVTMLTGSMQSLGLQMGLLPLVLDTYVPALARVLGAPADLPLPENPRQVPQPIREGIVFEDVHFNYPGSSATVLRGVSFQLRPGESLALVGHNSAGKSTIVKLLLRLYDPTKGRITLDGVDIREYDPDELRQRMGAIFQDFVRYELTSGENIALGQVERLCEIDEILDSGSKGGAQELLEGLPEGANTWVGREFGGRDLSGGEWQKLALSRAFFRDCDLMVLNEPTASLDAQTEYEVYRRFHDLLKGKMTLLISHRFSTVHIADRIVFLADGRAQEEGSHDELMQFNGEYARLYRLQASQYLRKETNE